MDFDRLIPIIRRLALEAGDRIMEVYNGPEFEVKSKSDASPVTEADEAADAIISAGLRAAFPDVVLITEEQAASHALTAQTFLIVDPLDGTKEFVQRRGDFTVNIAYVQNGVPTHGIVYAPAKDRMFAGDVTAKIAWTLEVSPDSALSTATWRSVRCGMSAARSSNLVGSETRPTCRPSNAELICIFVARIALDFDRAGLLY